MTTALPQVRGRKGEEVAVHYLRSHGYEIVARNVRFKGGEIDVVAKEKEELVFVEVKSRSTKTFGWPEEGVTFWKRKRMKLSASLFLSSHRVYQRLPYRFDIIALEIDASNRKARVVHYKNVEIG
ncbi:MAG: YraN family protein [Patescibacteria group bacterium]